MHLALAGHYKLYFMQHAMLFFLHHCELPSLGAGEHRVDPAPVNLQLQQPPRLPPAGNPDPPPEPQPQEEPEHAEQTLGEPLGVEEQNDSTLLRPRLHRLSSASDSNLVFPGTSVDPPQERNSRSQLLSDDELRKIRLQHLERRRDSK